MNETTKSSGNFVVYEYKEITTSREMEGVYVDSYPSFGWELDSINPSVLGFSTVSLKFKRDRKIRNKAELCRLQRQFEQNMGEIENLERSKPSAAMTAALAVGLIGTALMAGATFSYLGGLWLLMAALALPGFIGWFAPYFLYKKTLSKRIAAVTPLIEQQYDAIYETCQKAHGLLAV